MNKFLQFVVTAFAAVLIFAVPHSVVSSGGFSRADLTVASLLASLQWVRDICANYR